MHRVWHSGVHSFQSGGRTRRWPPARVVDIQRNKLFAAILQVSEALRAPEELMQQLRAAENGPQFSKAVDAIKAALPDALCIDGHSPLRLLYAALSRGIHEMTDAECLEEAQAIRLVLTELLDRVGQLLTENKELRAAVTKLLPKKDAPA